MGAPLQRLAAATGLVLICISTSASAQPAADFNVRFEYAPCGPFVTERLDTSTGVFTTLVSASEPERTVSTPMTLSDAQMLVLSTAAQDIHFFDYPAMFSGVPAEARQVFTTMPAATYRVELRNGGLTHAVTWVDASRPSSAEADQFRHFISLLRGFIHDHPAFKQLAAPQYACA